MPGEFLFTGQVAPVCEIGLGATRAAEPESWLDVSCYVHECEVFRGRERFNERFEPGTAAITFDNRNGWGDLVGAPALVAAAPLRPGRPIRIGVRGPFDGGTVTTRWLWRGYIDQAAPAYDPVLQDVVSVACIDALGEAGQTTAPQDAFQGDNETVTARIHRALDAVGWWAAKRKIGASATLVQGTQLGSPAMDLMGQAADSAGGVVYGDLDGDVVFNDLNWMLYDPAVPHDGEIGNMDPGEPGLPHEPVYVDPTPGPVYDPAPPPLEHPPIIVVCPSGSELPPDGTLIEQGASWRLFVSGGILYYESGGWLWNMGPYTGGCVRITPPPEDGGPEDGPERDCPEGQVWDTETGQCVVAPEDCPEGQVWDTVSESCVPEPGECEDGLVWDPATETCIPEPECPEGQGWDPVSGTCVDNPPPDKPDPPDPPPTIDDPPDDPDGDEGGGVELIGWSQGCASDPPDATVAVACTAPGANYLLVAMMIAQPLGATGLLIQGGGTVTGGGLEVGRGH